MSVKLQTNYDYVIQLVSDFSRHDTLIIVVDFVS